MRDSRALNSSTISLLSRVLCTYKVIRGIKAADCAKRRSLNVKESHDNQYDCLGSLLIDASWCSSRNQAVDPSINNSVVRVFIRPRFFQASSARLVDEFHRRFQHGWTRTPKLGPKTRFSSAFSLLQPPTVSLPRLPRFYPLPPFLFSDTAPCLFRAPSLSLYSLLYLCPFASSLASSAIPPWQPGSWKRWLFSRLSASGSRCDPLDCNQNWL